MILIILWTIVLTIQEKATVRHGIQLATPRYYILTTTIPLSPPRCLPIILFLPLVLLIVCYQLAQIVDNINSISTAHILRLFPDQQVRRGAVFFKHWLVQIFLLTQTPCSLTLKIFLSIPCGAEKTKNLSWHSYLTISQNFRQTFPSL